MYKTFDYYSSLTIKDQKDVTQNILNAGIRMENNQSHTHVFLMARNQTTGILKRVYRDLAKTSKIEFCKIIDIILEY